ncbi:hypothetical protein [Aquimonas voraii]|uniref:Uncharacterized protein n=1 Tax=Aquimonas voraii TaxID=265719 RepID=A0A1G6Z3T9_9GAMM|nr:hypothetical protein [Aquimonas voraii]SDD97329.1 hypothetical protein SAMN04488509_11236 [Aquimonas voraii]
MIFDLGDAYPTDETERQLPDAASALALVERELPDLLPRLRCRHAAWARRFGPAGDGRIAGLEAAIALGVARLGLRHGRYGNDFHAYHNEAHALHLLLERIDSLYAHPAAAALGHEDWLALELFAATHDLRQREHGHHEAPVGANEAASIAEALRILAVCGFSAEREPQLHLALGLMIAGSTFDARPSPSAPDPEGADNSAELVAGGGALASRLPQWLAQRAPALSTRASARRGLHLACIAADLDTANVGEPFGALLRSARELAEEREMRAGRRLGAANSAQPCRDFLLHAQTRYLEELHRFASTEGEAWLGAGKRENVVCMRGLVAELARPSCSFQRAASGSEVLHAFTAAAGLCVGA